MGKSNRVNTMECRKLDMLHLLSGRHTLTVKDFVRKMGVSERSVHRYLAELRAEKKVYKRYTLPKSGAKKPIYYYCIRRT